jgi:polycomb protein EED
VAGKQHALLAVGGALGVIKLIDCAARGLHRLLHGHGGAINELRFSPSNKALLFSASKDESVRLWNVRSGCCIAIFAGEQGHRDEVLSIVSFAALASLLSPISLFSFAQDVHMRGHLLASSGMDTTVKLWRLTSPRLADRIALAASWKKATVAAAASSASAAADGPLALFPSKFPTMVCSSPAFSTALVHGDYVDCVRFVGDLILSKSTGCVIHLWKPNPARRHDAFIILRSLQLPHSDIWFIKFSCDETREHVAAGNRAGQLFIYDIDAGEEGASHKLSLPSCKSTIRHAAFSPNGKSVVAVSDDGQILRFDRRAA